jgi:hypothetical protein
VARLKPVACLGLLVVAVAEAAVALGAGGSAPTRTVTVGAFDRGAVTTRCPGSQRPLLAGVKASTGPRHGLVIAGLRPQGKHAARAAAANVFVNPAPLALTAYCADARSLRFVSRSAEVAPATGGKSGRRKVTASCPRGESVRLAGYRAAVSAQPQGPSIVVNLMRRSSRRSVVVGGVNRGTAEGPLRAIAGCAPGRSLDVDRASAKLPGGGGRAAASARCPHAEHVVFGGFQIRANDGAGPYLRSLARPARNRWRVSAFQFKRPGGTVAAIAYCGGGHRVGSAPAGP